MPRTTWAKKLILFKLGDPATGWFPSQEDIDVFSQAVESAEENPDENGIAKLVTHFAVKVEILDLGKGRIYQVTDSRGLAKVLKGSTPPRKQVRTLTGRLHTSVRGSRSHEEG